MDYDQLLTFMARACRYAQEHIADPDAWPTDASNRENWLQCTSYQIACFLSQNTVLGDEGVDWPVIIDELIGPPYVKTEDEWQTILSKLVEEFGGWKA